MFTRANFPSFWVLQILHWWQFYARGLQSCVTLIRSVGMSSSQIVALNVSRGGPVSTVQPLCHLFWVAQFNAETLLCTSKHPQGEHRDSRGRRSAMHAVTFWQKLDWSG